ncbi:MAG TPA: hypothetical protein VKP30_16770, partial [Polyangiaceae bacterium]|nr:hypothetical protein [Polyangiaceae bacterium]
KICLRIGPSNHTCPALEQTGHGAALAYVGFVYDCSSLPIAPQRFAEGSCETRVAGTIDASILGLAITP